MQKALCYRLYTLLLIFVGVSLPTKAYDVVAEGLPAAAASRIRGEHGEISLTIVAALTDQGIVTYRGAWLHMAAMVMAVDHFNERNPIIVPELTDYQDCGGLHIVNVSVVDTETNSHQALKTILLASMENGGRPPDAIVGPYNELPALELSVMATGMEAPLVAIRGSDHNLILPEKHPYYTQVNPDLTGEMHFVGEYLKYRGRTNHIAILHSTEDSVLQRVELLQRVLKRKFGIQQIKAYSYQAVDKTDEGEERGLREAVRRISQTGFRTILFITGTPDLDSPEIGQAAQDYELDQGGHFWIIPGSLDASSTDKDAILVKAQLDDTLRFIRGASYIVIWDAFSGPWDASSGVPNSDFGVTFFGQNATFVQRLRDLNPVPNFFAENFYELDFSGKEGEAFPPNDIFQRLNYDAIESTGFAYDAVMAIGLGACRSIEHQNDTTMTGEQHLKGIRSVDFQGLSGQVKFGETASTPGSRVGTSVYHGVINLLPPKKWILIEETDYLDPTTQKWVIINPYTFADGTTNPPKLLRSTPEQNYLDATVRAAGLSLASLALLAILFSALWVFINNSHSVVIAAQPPFLYILCMGSILTTISMFISSFDESSGWDEATLDVACIAIPWLVSLGHVVTYSALFTKLWRVNKVLKFKRARIKVQQVVWPAVFLIVAAIIVMAIFTATDDFKWERTEIDDLTGESIGRCKGEHTAAFLVPVGIICLIPTLLTCIMAWKTSDVDDLYSESKWIFTLVLVQLQVIVVGAPVVAILQDVSTNGRYIGLILIIWTFPMSSMGLIMAPKMMAVRRAISGTGNHGTTRGSRGQGSVTGIQNDNQHLDRAHESTEPSSNGGGMASAMGLSSPRIQVVTME